MRQGGAGIRVGVAICSHALRVLGVRRTKTTQRLQGPKVRGNQGASVVTVVTAAAAGGCQ